MSYFVSQAICFNFPIFFIFLPQNQLSIIHLSGLLSWLRTLIPTLISMEEITCVHVPVCTQAGVSC